MAATRIVTNQLVSLAESNGLNICTGGAVLSWIDVAAGLAAKTLARCPCVTASVDAVHFVRPCRVGSVMIIIAMVNRTFTSSMEIGVRVEEECRATGLRHHCCSAYLTFVAKFKQKTDSEQHPPSDGKTVSVTASLRQQQQKGRVVRRVYPTSSKHRLIYDAAQRRRTRRLQERERLRNDPDAARAEADTRLVPITHSDAMPSVPPFIEISPEKDVNGTRTRVAPSFTRAHLTHIIMPQHANSIGITFGGQIMKWMEQAAFIAASRLARGSSNLLTASMDGITFLRSTKVGDSVYVEAQATAVFERSIEVFVSIWGEVPEEDDESYTGEPFHCGNAWCTVVSVDDTGSPKNIPFELVPETEKEAMRMEGARDRKKERLAAREAFLMEHRRSSLDDGQAA